MSERHTLLSSHEKPVIVLIFDLCAVQITQINRGAPSLSRLSSGRQAAMRRSENGHPAGCPFDIWMDV